MNKASIVLAGVVAMAGLTACQSTGGPGLWGPTWSEVSGSRYYNLTDPNRFPTAINLADGRNPGPRYGYGRGDYSYYKIDPGQHTLELSAINTTPNWVSGINRLYYDVKLEPCKRYYVNADFENRLLADWKPVVDYVEPIAGCSGGAGGY